MRMTEQKLWQRMKSWLCGYSVRLENAVSEGLSDALWCPRGLAVFLELKIQHGNWIVVRNSQMVFGLDVRKSVPNPQHLFVVYNLARPALMCYTYNTIKLLPSSTGQNKAIRVLMKDAVADYEWSSEKDVSNYLSGLEETNARFERAIYSGS